MRALQGLPLCDPGELEAETGFVGSVRSLVMVPLTSLGVLASFAALSAGNLLAATLVSAAAAGVVISLLRDTRYSAALARLRSGRIDQAESDMAALAQGRSPNDRQRRRAEAYLSAIAWARGRHDEALRWARARQKTLAQAEAPADERFLNDASVVLLQALVGAHDEAATDLQRLGETPMGERWARAEASARLSLAFARDDVDPVRNRLREWLPLVDASDPLLSGWLAWAFAQTQSQRQAEEAAVCARAGLPAVGLHVPRLADWLGRWDGATLRYRR